MPWGWPVCPAGVLPRVRHGYRQAAVYKHIPSTSPTTSAPSVAWSACSAGRRPLPFPLFAPTQGAVWFPSSTFFVLFGLDSRVPALMHWTVVHVAHRLPDLAVTTPHHRPTNALRRQRHEHPTPSAPGMAGVPGTPKMPQEMGLPGWGTPLDHHLCLTLAFVAWFCRAPSSLKLNAPGLHLLPCSCTGWRRCPACRPGCSGWSG